MSYIDAFLDRDKDCIQIVERTNSTREYKTLPAKYTFYYKDPKGKFKSIYGDPLQRVQCNNTKTFRKERKFLGNKVLFESDVNPIFQCLSENYIDGKTPTLHTCFFDIEVDFDSARGYADPSNPFAKITAITLGLDWIDKLITFVIAPKGVTKEQSIKIEASSGLSEEEIEKMVKDAEAHSEDDKKFEELVQVKNMGENLVHSCKKTLEEAKDKVKDEEKKSIEKGISDLEEALKSEDKNKIDEKIKALSEVSAPLAQRLYEEEAKKSEKDDSENQDGPNTDNEAVDADFEEVNEEDKSEQVKEEGKS